MHVIKGDSLQNQNIEFKIPFVQKNSKTTDKDGFQQACGEYNRYASSYSFEGGLNATYNNNWSIVTIFWDQPAEFRLDLIDLRDNTTWKWWEDDLEQMKAEFSIRTTYEILPNVSGVAIVENNLRNEQFYFYLFTTLFMVLVSIVCSSL